MLIDEADTFLGENEELRGILNSGHRAGGQVIRAVGDDFEPRAFSTHCPVAIVQIGKLPGTLADRSIHISMKRRTPGETMTRFRLGRAPEIVEGARKAARWVADNADAIRECDPNIPGAIFNRAVDNWEPLVAIAEVAGGDIPERAKKAALASCGLEEEQGYGTMLLTDIREAFAATNADRMTCRKLVEHLAGLEDRPWAECNHGKAMTHNGLAKTLGRFGVKSKNLKAGDNVSKGYQLEALRDAFSRYCQDTSIQSATAASHNEINNLRQKQSATNRAGVAVHNQPKSLKTLDGSGVAVKTPESGARAPNNENVPDENAANPRIARIEPQSSDTVGDAWKDRL